MFSSRRYVNVTKNSYNTNKNLAANPFSPNYTYLVHKKMKATMLHMTLNSFLQRSRKLSKTHLSILARKTDNNKTKNSANLLLSKLITGYCSNYPQGWMVRSHALNMQVNAQSVHARHRSHKTHHLQYNFRTKEQMKYKHHRPKKFTRTSKEKFSFSY